jgi:hypothetical protein
MGLGEEATARMTVLNGRLIAPALGLAVSLLAYFAQNVWHVFHIEQMTAAIRSAEHAGMALAFLLIGIVEGTVLLCVYLPGTAIAILLWLSLQPTWLEATGLMASLLVGTLVGFGLSYKSGQLLDKGLPNLIGAAHFRRTQHVIERFGLIGMAPAAFHPNHLSLVFAILGYFRARNVWAYFIVAAIAQSAWWVLYASAADLIAGQAVVTASNFQLYLAALFGAWLLYELMSGRRRT